MRKLLLLLCSIIMLISQLQAQSRVITGKVTDETGAPIPQATVIVKGTQLGTSTNNDGTYSLTVPASAKVIVISAVGLTPEEYTIGTKTTINGELKADNQRLQEVVVVGYGVQQKKAFTGSASKVDVKEFANLMTPSVDKQLAGRATGVQVTNVGGQINSPARIRIRGTQSLTRNNDPLIVVDGVPIISNREASAATTESNVLGDINPADIESVDVLKDGSATAIFGSRAAAGVIMITTKKGTKGRARVSYDGFVGFNNPLKRFDLLDAQEFVTIANEKFTNASQAPRANPSPDGINTDWQKEAMNENAAIQNHTLSVQGGNAKSTYYLSLNYSNQKGIIRSNYNKAYRIRLNLDHEVNRFLKIGNNLNVTRQEDGDQNNGSNSLSGAIASSLRLLPNVSPYNPNHFTGYNINYPNSNSMNGAPNTSSVDDNFTNVAFTVNNNKYYSDRYRILNTTYLEISPVKGLKLRSQFLYDLFTDYSYYGWLPYHGDGYGTPSGGTNGRINNTTQNISRYVWQNYINYNLTLKNHNFFVTAGHELQQDKNKWFGLNNNNISDAFFIDENYISGTATTLSTSGSVSEGGFESLFARLNYDFLNKYFIQGSIRRDGQSSLAADNRYGVFPGASIGWRPSQEAFWSNSAFLTKYIPEVKIKASYAKVGNNLTGFPYLSTYGSRPYGNISGIAVAAVGNPALQWETSAKYDLGIELGLLNNRFTLVADWFLNDVDNLVFDVPTPLSTGIPGNSISQNIASLQNRGIELSLNGNIIRTKDFSWDFNVNYSNVQNKITSLYEVGGKPVEFVQNGNYNIIQVGDPINIIYGNQFAGVNSSNGNPVYVKADGSLTQLNLSPTTANPINYYAASGKDNPTLGPLSPLAFADRRNLGNPVPVWFGGFSNTLTFKGFTLDFMLRYSGGNKIMNITRQEALLNQSFQNNGKEILNRWTAAGQVTDVPKLYWGQGNNINQTQLANSRFVESGDYLRLQNVVVSYTLPGATISRLTNNFVSSVRFYAQGQNLAVWSKYKGADPDNISSLGLDNAVSPQIRTISLGLNVGF